MFAISASVLFAIIAIMTLLVAFGLPLGEFTEDNIGFCQRNLELWQHSPLLFKNLQ